MAHEPASVPGPFRSAHLAVRSVVQTALACLLILQSIVVFLIIFARVSIGVVVLPEVGLAEHVVGLVYLFELAVCALVAVGVVFLGEEIELLLDFLQGCIFGHAEDLVVILAEVDEFLLGTVAVAGLACQPNSIRSKCTVPFAMLP